MINSAARERQRAEDRARWLAERQGRALARIGGEWVDDEGAFTKACRSLKLRRVAARWNPSLGSLLLSGPTGIGKTATVRRALRRLVREAEHDRVPVLATRWATASRIALARRQSPLGAGEPEELTRAVEVPLLVIDELGFEPLDEGLFDVLDERYQRALPVIVTSGLRVTELRDRYGAAALRRLVEPRGVVVEDWPRKEPSRG
ncbi:MAG: ATP-binding protein [Myxococcales bacterium]|nr:ATP-binding protein [Myxococcales bacterium]MCB9580978.1 ATP-binding protein [Polyangiaceae bacterium]